MALPKAMLALLSVVVPGVWLQAHLMWRLEQCPLGCFSILVCVPLRHPVPLLSALDSSLQLLPPAEMGSSPQPFPFGAFWVTCLSCASPSARRTKLCLAGLSRVLCLQQEPGWGEEVPGHRGPVLL